MDMDGQSKRWQIVRALVWIGLLASMLAFWGVVAAGMFAWLR
jgi:hypothetical protein